jgi:hypothetical protein
MKYALWGVTGYSNFKDVVGYYLRRGRRIP